MSIHTCQGCNKEEKTTTVQSGDKFCSVCLAEYFIKCLVCGEYVHVDESTDNHCDSCEVNEEA
jgi:hypothetical protein